MKKNVGKAKVILGATLATGIVAGSVASYMGYGPFSTRAASLSSNFSTNQNGFGQQKTITIDGDFSDWDSSMLIAQGVANDDPRAFRGPHEGPVYDTYAMYGAWDNDNLYLMWEITNLTDVVAPEQNYPISDNGKAWNGDIPQIIALDIDPNVSADGTITSSGKGVWGMSIDYTNGVDNLLCFSSKLVAGTPALFSVDGNGGFSYEKEFCRDFKTLGIEAAYGDGHISEELIGINANGYTGLKTDMMYSDSSAWVDLNKLGHNSEQDTMYEIKIPLSALGIDAHYITENGIGVMHISTFGESAIQTLPVDTCIYDNAEEPYAADDSTSQEKADEDTISVSMARLGKGDGPVPTKLPTAKPTVKPTEEPTIAPTVKPTVIPTCIPEETETPYETIEPEKTLAPTDYNYGKPDNNNHDNEEVYNIEKKNNPSKAKLSADDMKNGTILHAWSWSFNTIKENLQNIQNAGYSAIQTSPAQICRNPNGGDRHLSNWEYQYQPIGFKVGNYQLGTEDDLKALCAEADKYGIKIIVDCVYNHLTYDMQLILPEYRVDSYYHGREGIDDYNNRYRVTQKSLLGLYDMNTQNPEVQNIILNYAKQLVSDGVDGFRYDAAKHIELPDDDASYRSNFWPVVLNNGSSFQYGEILQDAASRDNAYSKLMGVTASGYGYILREQLGNKTLNTNKLLGYSIDAPSSKVVTWVESHDNFANKDCETVWMTNDDLKLGWAVIAGRASTTPLFYSRPVGAGGTSYDSRFPGLSQLGDAGDEFYMSADVTAINIFRNEMEGENEYLSNPDNSESVLFIERGNKGILIANASYSDYSVNKAVKLADGEYISTNNNRKFTVSNGKLTGTVPARGIAVLYKSEGKVNAPSVTIDGYTENVNNTYTTDGIILKLTTSNSTAATYSINDGKNYKFTSGKTIKIGAGCEYGTKITVTVKAENNDATTFKTYTFTKVDPLSGLNVTFTKPSSWNSTVYAYVYKENGSKVSEVQAWPGVAMTVSSGNKYTVRIDDSSFDGGYVIFSDGNNQTPGARETGFVLNNNGNYDVNGLMGNVTEGEVVVYYYTGWSNANIHYSVNGGAWTAVPGMNMTSAGNGYMKATIKNVSGKLNFCFNDGKGNWDNNGGSDYELKETGTFTIKDGKITKGEPAKVETNSITIYYSTSWSNANCHYSIGGGTWTSVPGVSMTNGKNGYKVITIDLNTSTNLTACFNDGNGNWDNNYSKNYYFGAAGTYTVSNGNVTSGAAY